MSSDPILLIGGSGIIGRWTARFLRAAHPGVPLLIGGRDLARAEEAASEIGNAQGVVLDLAADDLRLGARPVSAVATFLKDDMIAGLRFAQARSVPHISISAGIIEIGPEVAAYIHRPDAAPVVLGAEWLVGATTVPTLEFAKEFGRVHDIAIGALLDEQDAGGPAAAIVIELAGEDHAGRPLRTRHAVVHPDGQMPLTGLGVAMVLERLVGLDGNPATLAGLYFPYQLLEPTTYFARLEQIGGTVLKLDFLEGE